MNRELVITNAQVVLRDRVTKGTVRVLDHLIDDVSSGSSCAPAALDIGGDFLVAGLIDLHSDGFERHLMPRPGVLWPRPLAALLAHDAELYAAGITTALDAIALGDPDDSGKRSGILPVLMDTTTAAVGRRLLRVDHRIHLRCELIDPQLDAMLDEHADNELVTLLSLMDHSVGERQWRDHERYRRHRGLSHMPDSEFKTYVQRQRTRALSCRDSQRKKVVRYSAEKRLLLATHDDPTLEHVEQAVREGASICEFLTTHEAAVAARRWGLAIAMGAPNVVLGGSHSGNVAAVDLAKNGLVDILSSDYVPHSLLHAAFAVQREAGMSLPEGLALITTNPARVLGLSDRGEIAPGCRADLLRVSERNGIPMIRGVLASGEEPDPAPQRGAVFA